MIPTGSLCGQAPSSLEDDHADRSHGRHCHHGWASPSRVNPRPGGSRLRLAPGSCLPRSHAASYVSCGSEATTMGVAARPVGVKIIGGRSQGSWLHRERLSTPGDAQDAVIRFRQPRLGLCNWTRRTPVSGTDISHRPVARRPFRPAESMRLKVIMRSVAAPDLAAVARRWVEGLVHPDAVMRALPEGGGPKVGLVAVVTRFAVQDLAGTLPLALLGREPFMPAKVPIRPENHYRAQLVFLPVFGVGEWLL